MKMKVPSVKLPVKVNKIITKTKLGFVKKSPEIFLGLGIAMSVGSLVMAIKATLDIDEILDDHKKTMDEINTRAQNEDVFDGNKIKAEKLGLFFKTTGRMCKLYLPAIGLEIGSICLIHKSHSIVMDRYLAASSLAASTKMWFDKYRARNVEMNGQEADDYCAYGIKNGVASFKSVDPETGFEVIQEEPVKECCVETNPAFIRIFGTEYTAVFEPNAGDYLNEAFISGIQQMVQDDIDSGKYVCFNWVLSKLGYKQTKIGQRAGWLPGDTVNFYAQAIKRDDGLRGHYYLLDFNCRPDILYAYADDECEVTS